MTIQSSFDFSSSKFHQRQQLRQFIRQQRAALTLQQQKFAKQKIAQIAVDFLTPLNIKNIAVYLSFDGEISTNQLIETLWRQGYHLYLPVLHPFSEGNGRRRMTFASNKHFLSSPTVNLSQIACINQLLDNHCPYLIRGKTFALGNSMLPEYETL